MFRFLSPISELRRGERIQTETGSKGTTVSVRLNGSSALSHAFYALVIDGSFRLRARNGTASFDPVNVKTDHPAFQKPGSGTTSESASRVAVRSVSASQIIARAVTASTSLVMMEMVQKTDGDGKGQSAILDGQSIWLVDSLVNGAKKSVDANWDIMIVI